MQPLSNKLTGKRRIAKELFVLLLLFFSIEFIGWGAITIYRVVIFPLSLLLMMVTFSMPRYRVASLVNVGWVIYFMWFCLCQFLTDDNPLFPLFTIPLALAITNFLLLKEPIEVDFAKIFVLYFIPHIIAIAIGSDYIMAIGGRFCGAHKDANFCGQLLSVSLLSALMLAMRNPKLILKVMYLLILIIDALLIFWTGSRGTMLSIMLVLVIMLLLTHMKKALKSAIVIGGVLAIVFLWLHIQALPDFVSPGESVIDSVLCRFKSDNMDDGGGRLELWEMAWERMFSGGYFFTPIGHIAATLGSINKFTHNTVLDFLVENGIIVGTIMVCVIFMTILKLLKKIAHKQLTIPETILTYIYICALSQFFFISAISEKIVWLFILCAVAIRKKNELKCRFNINSDSSFKSQLSI